MKRTALLFTCALLTTPVFAADDLCSLNLQKLDDAKSSTATLMDPLKSQIEDLHSKAQQEQAAGDNKGCIATTTQALDLLKKSEASGEGAAG